MRIWLITIGEPLPSDGTGTRLLRTGILASKLAQRGHDVVWWTSAFDHNRKAHRVRKDTTQQLHPNLVVKLLRSPIGYRKNISLARIANHYHLAWKFRRLAVAEPRPDLILSSLPTVELSLQAVRYAMRNKVPVVLDARDMWPDLLIDAIPAQIRWLAQPVVTHLRRAMQNACRNATAIIGITPEFVDWALGYAQRSRREGDRDFPLAGDSTAPAEQIGGHERQFWHDCGIGTSPERFTVCFFGNIGTADKYHWQYVVDAAADMQRRGLPISFVICGAGDGLPDLARMAAGCANIVFGGWVNAPRIAALMSVSQVGLIPYRNRLDFAASLPNKAIEYLSAGLPIVSSLNGALGKLLSEERAGFVFHSGKELAQILCDLQANRSGLESASRNARALYAHRFESQTVYGSFMSHLETLAKAGGPSPSFST